MDIPTVDPTCTIRSGLTNVKPAVFLGQGVWDDNDCETTTPSVRLLVGKDKSEGSSALAEKQICQPKGVISKTGRNYYQIRRLYCHHFMQRNRQRHRNSIKIEISGCLYGIYIYVENACSL